MSDLGWRADGIAKALAVGGVELEKYRRPGFAGGIGVRRVSDGGHCEGFESAHQPEADPTPEEFRRRSERI